ncbi:protein of unknown function (plasmid) [Cupriavidus neocaledonicus]|uniref:Uncharacterized protein n=1 Tax=Cupriavidus neocaledonicus TaxID=1040979 RepID=A0A375HMV7_9BURK|nr:protein of unknown function [Cupriavidus neocaledonicus]
MLALDLYDRFSWGDVPCFQINEAFRAPAPGARRDVVAYAGRKPSTVR